MIETTRHFQTATEREFGRLLVARGFARISSEASDDAFAILFRSDTRYVKISGTLHPHDYPYYFSVALGEGSSDWPESDWNAIPLWLLSADPVEGTARGSSLYEIPGKILPEQIDTKIEKLAALLESHGSDFLAGELVRFRELRATQNRRREPYKIYVPSKGGSYVQSIDAESARLREKFSQ